MAVFKKSAEVRKEDLMTRLCAKCILTGEDLVESRREILDMANKAITEYLQAAEALHDSIKAEIGKRVERWDALEDQRRQLLAQVETFEAKLGAAMVAGQDEETNAAEAKISKLHDEIRKVEDRQRIFRNATFSLSGAAGYREAEVKYKALMETIALCNELMDAVGKTLKEHLSDLNDKRGTLAPRFYPSDMGNKSNGLLDMDFPEELQLDYLRRMTSGALTIDDLLHM